MLDLIYRPEDEVLAELDKYKSYILGSDSDTWHISSYVECENVLGPSFHMRKTTFERYTWLASD
jgi:hypothetical protein